MSENVLRKWQNSEKWLKVAYVRLNSPKMCPKTPKADLFLLMSVRIEGVPPPFHRKSRGSPQPFVPPK
jgi:hypothetical protein